MAELTIPEDKLSAVSGIALVFYHLLDGRYMAGHWGSGFHWYLCWESDAARFDGVYIAPTWSWASINGPVRFCKELSRELSKLISFNATPATSDPFGRLQPGAFIRLRGPISTLEGLTRSHDVYDVRFSLDAKNGGLVRSLMQYGSDILAVAAQTSFSNATQRMLFVACDVSNFLTTGPVTSPAVGLLLEKIPDSTDDEFYRIGRFEMGLRCNDRAIEHKVMEDFVASIPEREVMIF
ncbi:hypothetical protein OQA88_1214 [Cercophora sp. LCS_1]